MTKLTYALILILIALTFMLLFTAATKPKCTCTCEQVATPALVLPVVTMDAQTWWEETGR